MDASSDGEGEARKLVFRLNHEQEVVTYLPVIICRAGGVPGVPIKGATCGPQFMARKRAMCPGCQFRGEEGGYFGRCRWWPVD